MQRPAFLPAPPTVATAAARRSQTRSNASAPLARAGAARGTAAVPPRRPRAAARPASAAGAPGAGASRVGAGAAAAAAAAAAVAAAAAAAATGAGRGRHRHTGARTAALHAPAVAIASSQGRAGVDAVIDLLGEGGDSGNASGGHSSGNDLSPELPSPSSTTNTTTTKTTTTTARDTTIATADIASAPAQHATELHPTARTTALDSHVSRLAAAGRVDDAFAAVRDAHPVHVTADVLNCLIKVCSNASQTSRAFQVLESLFPLYRCDPTPTSFTLLVEACGRVGDMPRAVTALSMPTFLSMPVVDRTCVYEHAVDAAARCAELDLAFTLVERMRAEGVPRSERMYAALVRGCARSRPLHVALRVLRAMRSEGVSPLQSIDTYNALLEGCARAGRLSSALGVVTRMKRDSGLRPDLRSYNALLACCGKARDPDCAFALLDQMQEQDGIAPNAKAYNSVVVACASVGDMERAFQVAATMRAAGIRLNVVTYNNLIEACCNAGRIERAFGLAKEMIQVHEVTPNSHTYNTLIRGCGQWGQLDAALRVLTSMRSAGVAPTVVTYSVAVAACARTGGAIALEWAFDLLRDMLADGVQTNIVTYNSLIHACARAGRADRAFHILDAMRQERISPDMVTLCSLVDACGRSGMLDRAFATIKELPREFPTLRPSVAAYNALLYASAKAGNLERLSHAYRELHRVGLKPNVVTYSTLIAAYASVNDMERARSTLSRMKRRKLRPNHLTFTSIIAGHGRMGEVDEALAMFEEARTTCGEPDEELYTAAIVAVIEGGGREETAMDLAESMKNRGFDLPNVLNRMMLRAGGLERTGDELAALLGAMEALGIRPTRAACESVVSAYAAEGNVRASFDILHVMNRLHYPPNLRTYKKLIECCGLAPDLGRAQRLFGAIRGEGAVPRRSGQFRTHHWIELYEVMLRAIVRAGDVDMATTYLRSMSKDCGHRAAEAAEDRILKCPLANRPTDSYS